MQTIQLTGVVKPISRLILGTDFFHLQALDVVDDVMQNFFRIGGNTLDTARVYWGGETEKALGVWMEQTHSRNKLNLLTKGAHHNQHGPRVNRQGIYEDIQISLECLRTDFIDIYALHRDDPMVEVGPIIEALNEQIEAKRIGAIGASNWTHTRIAEANAYAKKHGLIGFTFNNPNLSLAKAQEPYWPNCVSADAANLKWHTDTQFPLFSWSSQARGFFTERVNPSYTEDPNLVRVFYNDANWQRKARAEQLAQKKGVSAIQIALAYVLNQPFPTWAMIAPRNETEMRSCLVGAELKLTPEEITWLVGES